MIDILGGALSQETDLGISCCLFDYRLELLPDQSILMTPCFVHPKQEGHFPESVSFSSLVAGRAVSVGEQMTW